MPVSPLHGEGLNDYPIGHLFQVPYVLEMR